jgi:hypothetical protein
VSSDSVIETADVLEFDVRGEGEGRADGMEDGCVFGVLEDYFLDERQFIGLV